MNLLIGFLTLVSLAIVHGQQAEKATSIIPFPRIGRADRFFMSDKRNGNVSPGLIPFPRIGRGDGSATGIHESKRQLIPFPRVGKRPYWHYPFDPYFFDYEESQYPVTADAMNPNNFLAAAASSDPSSSSSTGLEDPEEKRNGGNGGGANNGGGMWFGPRLGKRRKRSIEESTSAERARDTLDTRTLVKILHNFNWAIVPIKERRTFTPRLGRSSEETGTHHHKSQPYSPRLGRSSREESSIELDNEDERSPMSRYSRSGSQTNSPNQPDDVSPTSTSSSTFTPRLGRDHFSPRLGRSGEDHE